MTISSDTRTAGPFVGNGLTVYFPFSFKIFSPIDLTVVVTDGNTGIISTLVLDANYEVTLNADQNGAPGGAIMLSEALSQDSLLAMTSEIPYRQPVDLTNNGGFYPSVINSALDRLTIFCQQLYSMMGRTLRFPISDVSAMSTLPSAQLRANNLLGFDGNGNPTAYVPASGSAADVLSNLSGASGSSIIGFIQAGVGAQPRTTETELRRTVYLSQFATPAQAVVAAAGKRLYIGAGESVTLNVPATFATIQAALDACAAWSIAVGGLVTIQVANGLIVPTATFTLNHPYGARINLIGNTATPSACILQPSGLPTFDLFAVSAGHSFGKIAGFRFNLAAKAGPSNNFTAVLTVGGGSFVRVEDCESNNWYYAYAARSGARMRTIRCKGNNAGDVAFWAFTGSMLWAQDCSVDGVSDGIYLGFGYQGEFGGVVEATNCTATNCLIGGFAALSNGVGRYYGCTANANQGSGFVARSGGKIEGNSSAATNNLRYGIEVSEDGGVYNLAVNTPNTLGPANAFAYLAQAGGQAQLASANGPLRLDSAGTSSVFFNTGGGLQFEVFDTPAAVDRVAITGGIGEGRIQATGTSGTVHVVVSPKGAGCLKVGGMGNYANDAAAAAGGVPLQGLYRNGSVVQIRTV